MWIWWPESGNQMRIAGDFAQQDSKSTRFDACSSSRCCSSERLSETTGETVGFQVDIVDIISTVSIQTSKSENIRKYQKKNLKQFHAFSRFLLPFSLKVSGWKFQLENLTMCSSYSKQDVLFIFSLYSFRFPFETFSQNATGACGWILDNDPSNDSLALGVYLKLINSPQCSLNSLFKLSIPSLVNTVEPTDRSFEINLNVSTSTGMYQVDTFKLMLSTR